MNDFFVPLTVASTRATIYVNPDNIIFVREVNEGTQLVTCVINDGMVLPIIAEKVDEVNELCRAARANRS